MSDWGYVRFRRLVERGEGICVRTVHWLCVFPFSPTESAPRKAVVAAEECGTLFNFKVSSLMMDKLMKNNFRPCFWGAANKPLYSLIDKQIE